MRMAWFGATGSFVLVALASAVAPPSVAQEPAEESVCMARMTQGKPGGDHEIRLRVAAADVLSLEARGYRRRPCEGFADMLRDSAVEMCRMARTPDEAHDREFAAIHGLSPREMCDIGERM